jgi:hypothetical protein
VRREKVACFNVVAGVRSCENSAAAVGGSGACAKEGENEGDSGVADACGGRGGAPAGVRCTAAAAKARSEKARQARARRRGAHAGAAEAPLFEACERESARQQMTHPTTPRAPETRFHPCGLVASSAWRSVPWRRRELRAAQVDVSVLAPNRPSCQRAWHKAGGAVRDARRTWRRARGAHSSVAWPRTASRSAPREAGRRDPWDAQRTGKW